MRVSFCSLIAWLLVGCAAPSEGEGEGEGEGYCAETNDVIICDGDSNCAFDPAEIDCVVVCQHKAVICTECPEGHGCDGFDEGGCQTGCNFAKDQQCPNVGFGCLEQETECAAFDDCTAEFE